MLSLPEVCDLRPVVVVDRIHPSVLQPVNHCHPSSLHLHGIHPRVLSQVQHHQAGHHLPSDESCFCGTIQLHRERLYAVQFHPLRHKRVKQ